MKIKLLLPVFLLLIIANSCQQNKKSSNHKYYLEGNALGTTYHITAISDHNNVQISNKNVDSVITAINNSLSTYQDNSLISKINKGQVLKVDQQFKDVYNAAREIYIETGGRFDPTIGILVNAWGFGPGKKLPNLEKDSSIVDSLKKYVGYNLIKIDEHGFLKKKYPQSYIDYNSIAKGYAIDRLGKMLSDNGFKNYLVEVGGEVLAKGKNIIKKRDWLVAIDNPNQTAQQKFISKIALKNQAMATSGNYRKFYIDKKTGQKYVHTLDGKTGYPVQSNLLSASVIAKNCTMADGYATAFMVLGFEKTKIFLKQHPELQVVLIYSDKNGKINIYHSKQIILLD